MCENVWFVILRFSWFIIALQEALAQNIEHEIKLLGTKDSYWTWLVDTLHSKRDRLAEMIKASGMIPIIPEGGYFMMADTSALSMFNWKIQRAWSCSALQCIPPGLSDASSLVLLKLFAKTFPIGRIAACSQGWDSLVFFSPWPCPALTTVWLMLLFNDIGSAMIH